MTRLITSQRSTSVKQPEAKKAAAKLAPRLIACPAYEEDLTYDERLEAMYDKAKFGDQS